MVGIREINGLLARNANQNLAEPIIISLSALPLIAAGVEILAARVVGAKGGVATEQGGLNLFKWDKETTTTSSGWREGDYMLNLPKQGSPAASWAQNSSRLREVMSEGKPIYDSYRYPVTGERITTGGFLRAERNLLESRGWKYNPSTGAYHPPGG